MILSANQGGLANRMKCYASCYRYSELYNIPLKVYWLVLSRETKGNVDHFLYCPFSALFQNKIEHDIELSYRQMTNFNYKKLFNHNNCILYTHPNLLILPNDILDNYNDEYDSGGAKFKRNQKKCLDFNYNNIPNDIKLEYIKAFKTLKLDYSLQEKINNFSKNNFDYNTISIHIRSWSRCNENDRAQVLFQDGIKKFEDEMKIYRDKWNKDINYYLASDSSEIINYFKNESELKDKIITYDRLSELELSRENLLGIQEDLIEMYLLSCKKNKKGECTIIGSKNSTYTEVAWYLSGCTKKIKII